jgi:hypothetical protein
MANGVSPSHVSSQNLVAFPFPATNLLLLKKTTFVLISPFQKGESFGCAVTCARVLDCKYLLRNNYIHTPSPSTDSLYSHLLSRHLFFTSRFSIPKPPWSFSLQIISHLASLYFNLFSSLCQKKMVINKSPTFFVPPRVLQRMTIRTSAYL